MEYQILLDENKLLKEEIEKLKNELEETKAHLKKYTAPIGNRIYYEKHKEEIKQRVKEYKEKTGYKSTYIPSPEKKKEYNRQAYLKRKEKLKNENIDY